MNLLVQTWSGPELHYRAVSEYRLHHQIAYLFWNWSGLVNVLEQDKWRCYKWGKSSEMCPNRHCTDLYEYFIRGNGASFHVHAQQQPGKNAIHTTRVVLVCGCPAALKLRTKYFNLIPCGYSRVSHPHVPVAVAATRHLTV